MSKSPKFQVRKKKKKREWERGGGGGAVERFYPADFESERRFHEPKNADLF